MACSYMLGATSAAAPLTTLYCVRDFDRVLSVIDDRGTDGSTVGMRCSVTDWYNSTPSC